MYKILQFQEQMLEQGQIVPRISGQIMTAASRFTVKTRAHICKHHTQGKEPWKKAKWPKLAQKLQRPQWCLKPLPVQLSKPLGTCTWQWKGTFPSFLPRADGLLAFTMNGVFTKLVKPNTSKVWLNVLKCFLCFFFFVKLSTWVLGRSTPHNVPGPAQFHKSQQEEAKSHGNQGLWVQ
jgi:hypothetical protein